MKEKNNFYAHFLKRPLDVIISLLAIILLSPVFLILIVLVRKNLGKPLLFKQDRPGLNENIFKMYKFRTMTDKKDSEGNLLDDHIRLTRFGKLLRATSLDELPELINILKGDMSFVGPRPLLVQYLPLYNQEQKRRHHVRPGLTGLAQINGRNSITWEEKFRFDVKYVERVTFLGDIKILISTVKKVFIREGINTETDITMAYFQGNGESKENEKD